jgi:hypothetical protein
MRFRCAKAGLDNVCLNSDVGQPIATPPSPPLNNQPLLFDKHGQTALQGAARQLYG